MKFRLKEIVMNDLFKGQMPRQLYVSLPYLYIAAGVLTIIKLWNVMAVFSGCMLIIAGFTVWSMRKSNRKSKPTIQAADESKKGQGLIHIVWRKKFESGHKQIDNQHRSLFIAANELIDAITNRQHDLVINAAMHELIRDIQAHFRTEEELLKKMAPGIVESHKEMHAHLLKELQKMAERVVGKIASPRELIGFLVFDVIANHLTREDTQFFGLIK
jgi:hemerythrin-like metal-binding protein